MMLIVWKPPRRRFKTFYVFWFCLFLSNYFISVIVEEWKEKKKDQEKRKTKAKEKRVTERKRETEEKKEGNRE